MLKLLSMVDTNSFSIFLGKMWTRVISICWLTVCLPWLWQWLPVPSELDGHTSGMFVCHPWSEPHTPPPLFLHAVSCGNKSNKYMNKNHLINEAVLLFYGIKSWDLLPQSYKSSCTKKLKNGTKNFSAWFGLSISIFQCKYLSTTATTTKSKFPLKIAFDTRF